MSTTIEWLTSPDGTPGKTWNPVVGCSPVSPGCDHCWAARQAQREMCVVHQGMTAGGKWTGEIRFVRDRLCDPEQWHKPCRVGVCLMSDLFHETLFRSHRYEVFGAMHHCSVPHTFVLLTKRPKCMAEFLTWYADRTDKWPRPNVWLGVTVENQEQADRRIPWLLQCKAARRFVSYEPALGPIDFCPWLHDLDWVIVGGETGPGARPMHPDWVRSVRDRCAMVKTQFFLKSWGNWLHESQIGAARACTIEFQIAEARKFQDVYYSTKRVFKWTDGSASYRVGRKRAGRLLDGRSWNESPTTMYEGETP